MSARMTYPACSLTSLCLPALILMFVILMCAGARGGRSCHSVTTVSATPASTGSARTTTTRSSRAHATRKMLWATGLYVGVVVPLSLGLGLGAALLINSLRWGGDLYKTIYFLPVMAALLGHGHRLGIRAAPDHRYRQ